MIEAREILIVDNNEPFVELMRIRMRLIGLPAIILTDSVAALREIQTNNRIGLLWTDFNMPVMDGCQLAREARIERPEMPIILATAALLSEQNKQDIIDAGVDLIINKFDLTTQRIKEAMKLAYANRIARLDESITFAPPQPEFRTL